MGDELSPDSAPAEMWAEIQRLRGLAASRGGRQPGDPPLKGIKVVDLGSAITAPLCCCILADLGADVVKVEAVGTRGDGVRFLGPLRNGNSVYFHLLNRGKRAIQIDGKTAAGQAVIHRLVKDADVSIPRISIDMAAFSIDIGARKAAISIEICRRSPSSPPQLDFAGYF